MNHNYRLIFLALSLTLAAACGAFGYELTPAQKTQVESLALKVGKEMKSQNKIDTDIAKVVESLVRNSYAQEVDPQRPEAPVSQSDLTEIKTISADVLAKLGITSIPVPNPPDNPQPVTPQPSNPPSPQPINPQPVTPPSPKPSNSNQNPMVWVFVPVNMNVPPAPAVPVAIWPKSATVNQAPTIIIHRGFGGNPPVIKYRYR